MALVRVGSSPRGQGRFNMMGRTPEEGPLHKKRLLRTVLSHVNNGVTGYLSEAKYASWLYSWLRGRLYNLSVYVYRNCPILAPSLQGKPPG